MLTIIHKKFRRIDRRAPLTPYSLHLALHVMHYSLNEIEKFSAFRKVTEESKLQFKICFMRHRNVTYDVT